MQPERNVRHQENFQEEDLPESGGIEPADFSVRPCEPSEGTAVTRCVWDRIVCPVVGRPFIYY
ncbi:MAG: hypothetical protein LBQ54_00730 [Planctomycetaceae bacterium]|nr:hypothetical protein [Planctomycetaceae bacterium]